MDLEAKVCDSVNVCKLTVNYDYRSRLCAESGRGLPRRMNDHLVTTVLTLGVCASSSPN
jgi:hypothetical protein